MRDKEHRYWRSAAREDRRRAGQAARPTKFKNQCAEKGTSPPFLSPERENHPASRFVHGCELLAV